MQGQLRLARPGVARTLLASQRRLLATPPPPPPPRSTLPPTPPPVTGAIPVRPVVVVTPPVIPGSSTLASPPPPPPRKRRPFRRFLLYTALGLAVFYPLSGYLSTQFESYRDFFVDTFPGGEAVADFADDNAWGTFGAGTVSKKAADAVRRAKGEESTTQKVERKVDEARREINKAPAYVREKAAEARAKAVEAKDAIVGKPTTTEKVTSKATELKDKAVAAGHDAVEKTKEVAAEAREKVKEATDKVPFNFSEGVEGIVREAEKALGTAEDKASGALNKAEKEVEHLAHEAKEAFQHPPGPRVFPDTQRPRELRPETVTPEKPSYEGKQLYTGPPLPLGHEPPPGYYLAPPPSTLKEKVEQKVEEIKQALPLLVPKVKEFASEEPIISQLASTIDSLTSSLSTTSTTLSNDASGILHKAQDDLSALSKRLRDVKEAEKEKLQKTVSEKTKEFEALLKGKEAERSQSEQGLKQSWEKEREGMVTEWRGELEKELESQRQGIEQRLREEVVSQGIELQRRWLRSIKTQVETERGGRLAKLDHLTTSLKQLERITLDNSAHLDDNVRLHKIWSALRAVQSKADAGDVTFDDELRALKGLSAPSSVGEGESVIQTTLAGLEKSGIPHTGVKSFASLSSWFSNTVAPRVHSASLVPAPEDASVVSHLASAGLSKLLFRPQAGPVDGEGVGAILARAELALSQKDLDAAAREVNSLKGWPGKLASDWLREARRKLEVQQALEVVATEATLSSLLLV